MPKISSISKNFLILAVSVGVFLSFLPFQFARADNTPPVAENQSIITDFKKKADITLKATDVDKNDTLTYSISSSPANGTLSGDTDTDPYVSYTPNGGFSGTDQFTFQANDGQATSNVATVKITVQGEWCAGAGINPTKWLSCIGQYIISLPFRFIAFGLAIIIGIVAFVVGLLNGVVTALTTWAIDACLNVKVSTASPGVPDVVEAGWTFSQQFANLFIILVLAFIGLATILKIKDYEAKKMLPILIIVAILINFSPVIVGVIVDFGNIFTKFFTDAAGEISGFGGIFNLFKNYFYSATVGIFTADGNFLSNFGAITGQLAGIVLYGLVLIIFFAISAVVYFVYFLVFFARIVMLWLLMIVSPIAILSMAFGKAKLRQVFFPYILNWEEWMEELIRWSVIGVPLGFFLLLSNIVMKAAPGSLLASNPQFSGDMADLANFFSNILQPALGLAILGIGAMIAMQSAPKMAQGIMKWGKSVGMGAVKAGGKFAGTAAGRRIAPAVEKWGQRLEGVGLKPVEETGARGALARATHFGARWAGRGLRTGAAGAYMKVKTTDENEFSAGEKEATNKDSADNFRKINEELLKGRLANWNRVSGLLIGTRENGDGDDIAEAFGLSGDPEKAVLKQHTSKLKQVIKTGQRMGSPGYRPTVKTLFGEIMTDPEKFGYNAKYDEKTDTFTGDAADVGELTKFKNVTPEKFNPEDFKGYTMAPNNFDPKTKAGQFFIKTLIRERGADVMPQFGRRPNKKERDADLQYIFKEGEFKDSGLGIQWLRDNGAEDVLRYMTSPGARSAGIGMGLKQGDVDNLIAENMLKKTDEDLRKEQALLQNQLGKAQQEGRPAKQLTKMRSQLTRVNKELELRVRDINDLNQEISATDKRMAEVNVLEYKAADDYVELNQLEEILRRDRAELRRRSGAPPEKTLPPEEFATEVTREAAVESRRERERPPQPPQTPRRRPSRQPPRGPRRPR